jgi:hypothetical protein
MVVWLSVGDVDLVKLLVVVCVTGFAFILFLLAIIAVSTGLRR